MPSRRKKEKSAKNSTVVLSPILRNVPPTSFLSPLTTLTRCANSPHKILVGLFTQRRYYLPSLSGVLISENLTLGIVPPQKCAYKVPHTMLVPHLKFFAD